MSEAGVSPVVLTAAGLEYHIGEQVVLAGVDLSVHQGERIGLIGRNGAGKSTLLKLLAEVDVPYGGEIVRRRGVTVGYLPQDFELSAGDTVGAAILAGACEVVEARAEYERPDVDAARHHELELFISAHDGWNLESRMAALMDTLQVPGAKRRVGELSGGEQRRVVLCRALIGQPDLLILDEPTNHLDTDTIEWLERFLGSYRGSCIMVTHDRYFLDNVTNRIFEVANGGLELYNGNYSEYLVERERRLQVAESREAKRQSFLKRELEWLRRGPKARTTKAQYRIDRYHEVAGQSGPAQERDVELILPPAGHQNNCVLEASGLTMSMGGKQLFKDLNLRLEPGHKVGIVGRNGAGKTTLLRLLMGELAPEDGSVHAGNQTRFNYVDQRRLQLDDDHTVYEEIGDGQESIRLGDQTLTVHSYLRRFLFTDQSIYSKVRNLSGGERSRLLMAKLLKRGGNVLILDEPTNDLDLATLRILEEAVGAFEGCALVVSHDRYFLNRTCTHILAFEGEGRVVVTPGDYDYYLEKRRKRDSEQRAVEAATKVERPSEAKPAAGSRKLKWKEQRELEGMEDAIGEAEAEVKRLETLFSSADFFAKHGDNVAELTAEMEGARAEVERLYARWEELEELRDEA